MTNVVTNRGLTPAIPHAVADLVLDRSWRPAEIEPVVVELVADIARQAHA